MSDKVEVEAEELAALRAKAAAYDAKATTTPERPQKPGPPSPWLAHPALPFHQAALLLVVVGLIAFAVVVATVWLGVNRAFQSAFQSVSPHAVSGQAVIRNDCPIPLPSMYLSQCDRPVAGAHILITPNDGGDLTDVTTGPDGSFSADFFGDGSYVLHPQPQNGISPIPASIPFTLSGEGDPTPFTVVYVKSAGASPSRAP